MNLPQVQYVNSIVRAIDKLSGMTGRTKIKQALMWGHGPTIEIKKPLICNATRAYGCYALGGDIIQVNHALVKAFESGRDKRATREGQMVHVTGVTLLHELTHWADAKDGVDNPVPGDPSNEEGNAFEKAVYGKVIVL